MLTDENDRRETKEQQFFETLKLIAPARTVFIQDSYHLNEIKFNIISKINIIDKSITPLLFSAIILSVEIISKSIVLFLSDQSNDLILSIFYPNDKFEKWKLIANIILYILFLFTLCISYLPTKRYKLIKKLNLFYQEHPPVLRSINNE